MIHSKISNRNDLFMVFSLLFFFCCCLSLLMVSVFRQIFLFLFSFVQSVSVNVLLYNTFKHRYFALMERKIVGYIGWVQKNKRKPKSNQQFYCSTWKCVLCFWCCSYVYWENHSHINEKKNCVFRHCIVLLLYFFLLLFVCTLKLARIGDTFCIHKRLNSIRM